LRQRKRGGSEIAGSAVGGARVGEKAARAFGGGVEVALKSVHKGSGVEKKNVAKTNEGASRAPDSARITNRRVRRKSKLGQSGKKQGNDPSKKENAESARRSIRR
jgi:hypothetical protein